MLSIMSRISNVTAAVTLLSLALGLGACGSNTSSGKTGGSSGTTGASKPAAPSMLTAQPLLGGVHLTWKDNSSDEEMFMIMRKEGTSAFATLVMVEFNIVQYHDTAVTPGKTYTYMVNAMKGDQLSDPSNEAMIQLP